MARYPVNGRVALITGAAMGIGFETARALHARGASVVLTDLDAANTKQAAAAIGEERTLGLAADVTDRAALEKAVAATVERFGRLDIVVANAAVANKPGTVRAMDDEDFERTIAVDLAGVWHTVRVALPHIIEQRGHVVVVASAYAFVPGMLMTPYAMSKAAVEQLGRALRVELTAHGAHASVAYFGFVDTALALGAETDPLARQFIGFVPKVLRKRITPQVAGEAIAHGIERRRPTITAPRRWALIRAVRGVSDPVSYRYLVRNRRLMKLFAQAGTPDRPDDWR
jgi:NAD(P)-dependent dehydrogenase (short-subunit alcohol dehydrogenase family)